MEQQRKITDEREARRSLAAAKAAGGTIEQWARANGIDGRSLNAWRVNLARRGATAAPKRSRRGGADQHRVSARRPSAVRRRRSAPATGEVGPLLVELVPTSGPVSPAQYVVMLGEARIAPSVVREGPLRGRERQ